MALTPSPPLPPNPHGCAVYADRRSSTLPVSAFADKERSGRLTDSYPAGMSPVDSAYEATWIGEEHQLSYSNIAAPQDKLMGSPDLDTVSSPPSPSLMYDSEAESYSSLSLISLPPSLSYCPTSIESSRTH
ncbi:hypothetical protein K438DRAFT_1978994 [Mycena galopus ATCC 62051]|nr:hypothetical protein K438DRAFT_1978994 [Mycena galopus ATCC 62051]